MNIYTYVGLIARKGGDLLFAGNGTTDVVRLSRARPDAEREQDVLYAFMRMIASFCSARGFAPPSAGDGSGVPK